MARTQRILKIFLRHKLFSHSDKNLPKYLPLKENFGISKTRLNIVNLT